MSSRGQTFDEWQLERRKVHDEMEADYWRRIAKDQNKPPSWNQRVRDAKGKHREMIRLLAKRMFEGNPLPPDVSS